MVELPISKSEIEALVPYRDPFLFLDEITALSENEIEATYLAAADAPYFFGHFHDFPVMPGSLIAEGLGQAASFLTRYWHEDNQSIDIFAYRVDDLRFLAPVFPDNRVIYRVQKAGSREGIVRFDVEAFVEETPVARGRIVQATSPKSARESLMKPS